MRLESREGHHVDDLTLDAVRAGEFGASEDAHLEHCQDCEDRLQVLHSLADELRLQVPAAEVPPARDAAVRAAARAAGRRGRRRRVAFVVPVVAAIAAVGLFFVLRTGDTPRAGVATVGKAPAVAPLDVNRDGAVDILDAFALARTLDAGVATLAAWDANGDKSVDRLDVDAIARRAVSLSSAGQERL